MALRHQALARATTVGGRDELVGPESAELINFFGLAMRLDLKAADLWQLVSAYPSVGSDLGSLVQSVATPESGLPTGVISTFAFSDDAVRRGFFNTDATKST